MPAMDGPRALKRAVVARMRRSWLRSGHRVGSTRDLAATIAALRGVVLDVGGGREAPLDAQWPAGARRVRVDAYPHVRPDVVADAAALPFRAAAADAVVMCELLEHLADPRVAVADALRALRAGGVLCGSVPFLFPVHGDPYDFARYTEQGLRHVLAGAQDVTVVAHGNRVGAAWLLLSGDSRVLRLFNPVVRRAFSRPSPRYPEGYVFVARR
jgi:SAM-dependent methyltransferase